MELDNNLYSRQIYAYGQEAVKRITSSSVLIVDLAGGLANEVAKNLVLQGTQKIYFLDSNLLSEDDIKKGFYYHNATTADSRVNTLIKHLKDINPYVELSAYDNQDYDVLVYLGKNIDQAIMYDNEVSEKNKKFVWGHTHSNHGIIFNNFNTHVITSLNDDNNDVIPIKNVCKGKIELVTMKHNIQQGDRIIFQEVTPINDESMLSYNYLVKEQNKNILIVDNLPTTFKANNGYVRKVSQAKGIIHNKLEKQIEEPSLTGDLSCCNNHDLFSKWKDYFQGKEVFSWNSSINLPPVTSIIGALISSEVIKGITYKYIPFSQWFVWTDNTLDSLTDEDLNKIKKTNWFMIGAGAIGCELLKNFSQMGIENVTVTDPDVIEKSNLTRQFLFRHTDIGKHKSQVACDKIMKQFPYLNYIANTNKVCHETEHIYNSEFYNKLDGIANALDNYQARLYTDSKALYYQKPLLESGTQGTKGNTQIVVPFLTETYGDSIDPPEEESFPVCTVKNFPNMIQHCIHWAMEFFDNYFVSGPEKFNKFIDNNNYIENLPAYEKEQTIAYINQIVSNTWDNWQDVIDISYTQYYEKFRDSIMKLLKSFPEDSLDTNGELFWSNGKKCPKLITDNYDDDMIKNYYMTNLKIFESLVSKKYDISYEEVKEYLLSKKEPTYENTNCKIAKDDSELKEMTESFVSNSKPHPKESWKFNNKLSVTPFEKDDDNNGHISYIQSLSNLRARNYHIIETDFMNTKKIAGKIIPAIATTTALVAGLISMEIYKLNIQKETLDDYKSYYVNLSDNTIISSSPIKAKTKLINNVSFSSWDKFEENDMTIRELIDKYNKKFNTHINMVLHNSSILYSDFMSDEEDLNKKVSEFLEGYKEAQIIIACNEDIELPPISFVLI